MYMPPEALSQPPRYDTSLDIYSFGIIALFTITQDFPFPTSPNRMDPNNPGVLIPVTEVDRRSEQMRQLSYQLGQGHLLVQIITLCLDNNPRRRPSARNVITALQSVQSEIADPYQHMSKVELIHLLKRRGADAPQNQIPQLQASTATNSVYDV